jgi:hypothetical protein
MATTSMILRDLLRSTREKTIISTDTSPVETKIWIKFTYFGSDIRTLTKIFKNSRLKVAFNVNNTIKIRCKSSGQYDKYKDSGVYQLKCPSCEQVYIGQTGRELRTRYKEHIRDIRFNQTQSKYAQQYWSLITNMEREDTMEAIKTAQKGRHLDAVERFYIYKASKNKPILNEQYATDTNVLFDLVINRDKTKCSNK